MSDKVQIISQVFVPNKVMEEFAQTFINEQSLQWKVVKDVGNTGTSLIGLRDAKKRKVYVFRAVLTEQAEASY